jgi:hypothetical protein
VHQCDVHANNDLTNTQQGFASGWKGLARLGKAQQDSGKAPTRLTKVQQGPDKAPHKERKSLVAGQQEGKGMFQGK